ncbi:MAG TPA: scaffolding protein [Pirellulaceae bacterium]|nr:scaffolding protein [Pirellulaceae bacterium]
MSQIIELENEAVRLRSEGRTDAEIETLLKILELDETFARAHLALAVAYGKVGNFAASVAHGERACQVEPNDAFNFTALSVTYQRAYAGTNDHSYIRKAEDAKDLAQRVRAATR